MSKLVTLDTLKHFKKALLAEVEQMIDTAISELGVESGDESVEEEPPINNKL